MNKAYNAGSKDNPAPKQDALFLAEKQQLMAALKRIQKIVKRASDNSEEASGTVDVTEVRRFLKKTTLARRFFKIIIISNLKMNVFLSGQ